MIHSKIFGIEFQFLIRYRLILGYKKIYLLTLLNFTPTTALRPNGTTSNSDIQGVKEIQNWKSPGQAFVFPKDSKNKSEIRIANASYRFVDEKEMYKDSKYIVVGKVLSVTDIEERKSKDQHYSRVKLQITDLLKGQCHQAIM